LGVWNILGGDDSPANRNQSLFLDSLEKCTEAVRRMGDTTKADRITFFVATARQIPELTPEVAQKWVDTNENAWHILTPYPDAFNRLLATCPAAVLKLQQWMAESEATKGKGQPTSSNALVPLTPQPGLGRAARLSGPEKRAEALRRELPAPVPAECDASLAVAMRNLDLSISRPKLCLWAPSPQARTDPARLHREWALFGARIGFFVQDLYAGTAYASRINADLIGQTKEPRGSIYLKKTVGAGKLVSVAYHPSDDRVAVPNAHRDPAIWRTLWAVLPTFDACGDRAAKYQRGVTPRAIVDAARSTATRNQVLDA